MEKNSQKFQALREAVALAKAELDCIESKPISEITLKAFATELKDSLRQCPHSTTFRTVQTHVKTKRQYKKTGINSNSGSRHPSSRHRSNSGSRHCSSNNKNGSSKHKAVREDGHVPVAVSLVFQEIFVLPSITNVKNVTNGVILLNYAVVIPYNSKLFFPTKQSKLPITKRQFITIGMRAYPFQG